MRIRDYPKRPLDMPAPPAPVVSAEAESGSPGANFVGSYWDDLLAGGCAVSPESAMRHSAVYRCVFLIAASIAMLPLHTFERLPDGDRTRTDTHAAASLLSERPNPRMSPSVFWRQVAANMLLRGNGVVWIERKPAGTPVALWPIPFHRVGVQLVNARLRYDLQLDDGVRIRVDQDDVLHFPGSAEWDGVKAKTPIQAMGAAVGIGLEADRYAKAFFENDATPPSYVTYPQGFTQKGGQADELRKLWKDRFGGRNRHSGPAVLDQGGEVKQLQITAQDAQILETRRFQIEDIARLFGVPRFLLAMDETSWGSGIAQLGTYFVVYALDPHLKAIEEECSWKLFGHAKNFAEFERDALQRGDIKTRYEAYGMALGGSKGPGFMTPAEVRRRENLPPSTDPNAAKLAGWTEKSAKKPPKEDDVADE